jgi:hypothetical protein
MIITTIILINRKKNYGLLKSKLTIKFKEYRLVSFDKF